MTDRDGKPSNQTANMTRWYDLFSRGARDWLRHNEKVKHTVREQLPDLLADSEVITGEGHRKLQVPVRFLEHYRFRLRDPERGKGVGQGDVKPGDVLVDGRAKAGGKRGSGGGEGDGGVEFIIELEVDDIVDVLWEELELPHLEPRPDHIDEPDYTRAGWDRRGARARLDRRRTLKEAVKRRAVQRDGPAFSNDDLRFRQLVRRPQPSTRAAVVFGLDASSSMTEHDRKLAKAFFFWALQGLRRQYRHIDTAFVAHTTKAWEFNERDFFRVKGQGGTVASTAFELALEIFDQRFPPTTHNDYFFYASDGENFPEDQGSAGTALDRLGGVCRFLGYVETVPERRRRDQTLTGNLYADLPEQVPHDTYRMSTQDAVWDAIRRFFHKQREAIE